MNALVSRLALPLFLLHAGLSFGQTTTNEISQTNPLSVASGSTQVMAWNRVITVLRVGTEDSTPDARARRAEERIATLAPHGNWEVEAAPITLGSETGILITAGKNLILAMVPGDEDAAVGQTLEEAASAAVRKLKIVLDDHADALRWPIILKGLGLSGLAALVALMLLWGLARSRELIMKRLDRMIVRSSGKLALGGIRITSPVMRFERLAVRVLTTLAALVVVGGCLNFCLHRFFFTSPWAGRMGRWFVALLADIALGIIGAMPGIVTVFIIFWIARLVTAGISGVLKQVEQGTLKLPWLHQDGARASRRIAPLLIWLFAFTLAYPYIPGSGSAGFKGISVFAGVVLSLGSTGFVSHLMGGLILAYNGALRHGDYVVIGEVEGTVQKLGAVSTTLLTPRNEVVTLPNGMLVSGNITNYSRPTESQCAMASTTITIGYDAPWRRVHALLIDAAGRTAGIAPTCEPVVLQRALQDFCVEYELRVQLERPRERRMILSQLHANIQDAFNEAAIQIMSPHFMMQPETPVIAPGTDHIPRKEDENASPTKGTSHET